MGCDALLDFSQGFAGNRHGVYYIIPSMEMGSTFCSLMPKYLTEDPDYRILKRRPSRYLHYYFSIRDPVLGPLSLRVGTYLPDRFAGFEAQSRNVPVDFPLFQRIALPVASGKTKIAGIKIHDTRMMRLMEVLLHAGTQLNGWRSASIHHAILTTFGLSAETYTLTQLRYDLRKMKGNSSGGPAVCC